MADASSAIPVLQQWQSILPIDYILELQRTGRTGDEAFVHAAVDLATKPIAQ